MGKDEDSLLRFLSAEKGDLEKCDTKPLDTVEEADEEEEPEQRTVADPRRSCRPVFWTVFAAVLLIVALVSGAFQFCRNPPGSHHAQTKLYRPFRPNSIPYYEVPLRPRVVSRDADDMVFDPLGQRGSSLIRGFGFDIPRFVSSREEEGNLNSMNLYEGQALVRDGRAYLTSQLSSDDKGVVAKSHSVGRLQHSEVVRMKQRKGLVSSFQTTFVFSIENSSGDREATGDGFAFVMAPLGKAMGSAGGNLGVVEETPHTFAIEFDTWKNPSLQDMNNNHVGINVGSMVSLAAAAAGYWEPDLVEDQGFRSIDLTSGKIQAWIDYDSLTQELAVSISPILGWKPIRPLLKKTLDLSNILTRDMTVGFSAATGDFSAKHIIHSWKFQYNKKPVRQFEHGRSGHHWRLDDNQREQLEKLSNFRQWETASIRRDQVARVPKFRNPHRQRHGNSMRPDVIVVTNPEAAGERRPMKPIGAMKKPCKQLWRHFPTMDFSSVKELFSERWLWMLAGFISSFLFFNLLFITCRAVLGCCYTFWLGRSERPDYVRIFDEERQRDAGYVLVVSEEQQARR